MGKGCSGQLMSMSLVPIEARRDLKNNQSLPNQEPTSPKISCMGQIKQKHKKKIDKSMSFTFTVAKEDNNSKVFSPKAAKKRASMMKRIFTKSKPAAAEGKSSDDHERRKLPDRVPGLSQMKRFASGHETLAIFDRTGDQIVPETDRGTYNYSYEERGDSDGQEQDDEVDFIFPFSAPIAVVKSVALQPRKEVNVWKRRTTNPPATLQLNTRIVFDVSLSCEEDTSSIFHGHMA